MSGATELKRIKRLTDPVYKTPKSLQERIPISRISEDGIFEIENKQSGLRLFDKAYIFTDINFTTKSDDEKEMSAKAFEKILNAMNVSFKIIIANQHQDIVRQKERVLLSIQDEDPDNLNPIRRVYNEIIEDKLINGKSGIEQVRYYVITCEKNDYESAKAFFDTIETSLTISFRRLGSGLIPLNAKERLRALHSFYRLGKEELFDFDWNDVFNKKIDWRNEICNTAIKEHKDYLEIDNRVACVLFTKKFPNGLEDEYMRELSNVPFPVIITMDLAPIPDNVTISILNDKYMAIERSISKQQENRNKMRAYSSDISYNKRREKEEIEEYMDEVRSFDQKMFYCGFYVMVSANNKKELEQRVETVKTIGLGHSVLLEEHIYNQFDAMNTTLPVGGRYVDTMRPLLTDALAVFMPFNIQEICHRKGLYYGVNEVSKNLIIGSRKKLNNGNGFIFGIPGSGKSFETKMEMGQIRCCYNEDIIIIDPQNEYFGIAARFGGKVIDFRAGTDNHINPFAIPDTLVEGYEEFIGEKSEFAFGLVEQIKSPVRLKPTEISIIDRAVRNAYEEAFKIHNPKKRPQITMKSIVEQINCDGTKEARTLSKELDTYINGSLNMFSQESTVGEEGRFTVYGIKELGNKLKPMAMLIIMEDIRTRLKYNAAHKRATHIYIDEIHVLLDYEYSLAEVEKLWKEVRKQGGLATGMTQNVIDVLVNKQTKTMISNSEFVILFNQGNLDRDVVKEILDVSDAQIEYVCGVAPGKGLIRFGDKIVPLDATIRKDNELYELFNTNFHEKIEKNKKS